MVKTEKLKWVKCRMRGGGFGLGLWGNMGRGKPRLTGGGGLAVGRTLGGFFYFLGEGVGRGSLHIGVAVR